MHTSFTIVNHVYNVKPEPQYSVTWVCTWSSRCTETWLALVQCWRDPSQCSWLFSLWRWARTGHLSRSSWC